MPHGVASPKELKRGDLVTMDFGCIYGGIVLTSPGPYAWGRRG
jgi:Xaa-Pro aminopeptidase